MRRASRNLSVAFGAGPAAPLATLVSALRAIYQLHQSHHWLSKGANYYGDHLLYQRLYEAVLPEIDSVAERTVGNGGARAMDAITQAKQTTHFLEIFSEPSDAPYEVLGQRVDLNEIAARSLQAELVLVGLIDDVEASPGITAGTRNLLEGIADTHEGHIYLLQQRLSRA